MVIPAPSTAMGINAETIGQPAVDGASVVVNESVVASSSLPVLTTAENHDRKSARDNNRKTKSVHIYNPRKPRWWNRLGNNGRDATKSQKRAMRKVLDGEGRTNVNPSKIATPIATTTTTTATPNNSNNNIRTQTAGLRLPPVPYGSKLDWDELFPTSSDGNRDIWLELGFGRGENLQALLESKLSTETKEEHIDRAHINDVDETTNTNTNRNSNNNNNNTNDTNEDRTRTKKFYLVGAEVSGVGIGCLCKRIERLQQFKQKRKQDHCDDDQGYVLYRHEMDPYSLDPKHGETAWCDDTERERGDWIERNSLARIYDDRLRIHTGDGYKLLPKIPDGSLSAILVTFPDPFPKDTDLDYRLVQHQTLIECHRILRKEYSNTTNANNNDSKNDGNGRLFLATDHDGYHEWCHRIMNEVNNRDSPASLSPLFKLEETCPNRMEWLPAVSRYEQKGWDEGRSTKLSCWVAI